VIGMKMDAFKRSFFDSKRVMSAVDGATRRVLSRFGAFVRRRARSSIRKRKRISRPGEPPSSHVGLLRRGILFGYDTARQSVVIGPMRLNQRSAEAPPLLEYGGQTRRRDRRGRSELLTYRARPYMGPAFEAEKPGLPALWRDSVRR